jgi:multisubunit Na+/H+ antiporter MnhC subunit
MRPKLALAFALILTALAIGLAAGFAFHLAQG